MDAPRFNSGAGCYPNLRGTTMTACDRCDKRQAAYPSAYCNECLWILEYEDMKVDYECAVRDGLPDYAAKVRGKMDEKYQWLMSLRLV